MKRIDDAPLNAFHIRVAVYTGGGMFCDGYIIGSIGLALPLLTAEMRLSAVWEGLLAAAVLIGIFAGSVIFGPITDRIGRQKVLVADLILFVVASALQLFVTEPTMLLVLRLILGVAVGADYAIAPVLLSEFVPRRQRGGLLASIQMIWTVGLVSAFLVGLGLQAWLGADSWRWMLAGSAVPALITLMLRIGSPESPRWLISKGRQREARRILDKHFGPEYTVDDADTSTSPTRVSYRALFSRRYLGRTVFAGGFWFCQVFPYFAIATFLPTITEAFGIGDSAGELLYNLLLVCGAVVGLLIIDRIARRSFVIWSFAIVTAALLVLGFWPTAPLAVLLPTFLIIAFVIAAATNLETVYPSEIFPTEIRSAGTGLATGLSRTGAAISTFMLPTALDSLGIGPTMLILAAVAGIGIAISVPLAPETRGVFLAEAARGSAPQTSSPASSTSTHA
ncbi:putative MFS transporter [Tamaricihabitans halophyticus]|uniref:Putative MFS transporter n=1 Tax=Tamaricihabitans halophyticus TaxID=1262583 RepID=A0A4R2QFJ0_9PSEU|nr:MFS transporter [Tamaricihabitans halophyticus]TCP47274.1 putative MFS transporter [Tamaricihabitans halophyticus]